ncbi:transglutaminase domain-containing protein [Luteibacter sp. UNC138MFCol5.1]|uniref:transglutaminase-like domain-containing protein n=1 Tax=Luteibacter sp. UNC138MFCol5.1 TaxID=1502774 RepID=UPI000B08A48F|nr:transglutaminase domain-containing protein [Luteibacter sp. UNC138MFCol5.1]
MRARPRFAVIAAFLAVSTAHAADIGTWMAVTIDGRKVGHAEIHRIVDGDRVVTTQVLDYRLMRWKTGLPLRTEGRFEESRTGAPLAFTASATSAGQTTTVEGFARTDGTFQVSRDVDGQASVGLLTWPTAALLSEGQRLDIVRHGFAGGTTYTMRTFDALKQEVADIALTVVGDEVVELPSGNETLHHLRQTFAARPQGAAIDIWVDDRGDTRRSVRPVLGKRMELLACDEACAHAPDQDVDILRAAMVGSPRTIPRDMSDAALRYTIEVPRDRRNPFVETGEQEVVAHDYGYQLTIGPPQVRKDGDGPTPGDAAPNPWVQSTAPEIVEAAREVVGRSSNDRDRMARLRRFVSGYIAINDLGVGYASALETFQTRRGDCTEHAVLLAAMGRAIGISTRIVSGLVYMPRYAGASRVFVPHTWVQAWIKDRWVSFDSAIGRFDATHIALAVGDGDPWRFFSSLGALGSITIRRVDLPFRQMPTRPDPFQGMNRPEPYHPPTNVPASGGKP